MFHLVGIVWNDKLKFFGENIKVVDRFVTFEHFDAKYIVGKLENALKEGYKFRKEEYKETVYKSLKEGIYNTFKNKKIK